MLYHSRQGEKGSLATSLAGLISFQFPNLGLDEILALSGDVDWVANVDLRRGYRDYYAVTGGACACTFDTWTHVLSWLETHVMKLPVTSAFDSAEPARGPSAYIRLRPGREKGRGSPGAASCRGSRDVLTSSIQLRLIAAALRTTRTRINLASDVHIADCSAATVRL